MGVRNTRSKVGVACFGPTCLHVVCSKGGKVHEQYIFLAWRGACVKKKQNVEGTPCALTEGKLIIYSLEGKVTNNLMAMPRDKANSPGVQN
jgi:hypothetical protein